jgi:hypothetical protein
MGVWIIGNMYTGKIWAAVGMEYRGSGNGVLEVGQCVNPLWLRTSEPRIYTPIYFFCLPLAILPPLYDNPSVDFAELDLLDGTMGRFCAKCRHLPHTKNPIGNLMIREKEAVFCPNVLVLTLLVNVEIWKKDVKFVRSLKRGLHHVSTANARLHCP